MNDYQQELDRKLNIKQRQYFLSSGAS